MTSLALWLLATTASWAVPMQLSHSGRLLDDDGVPVDGAHDLTFKLWSQPTGGQTRWAETQAVTLHDGHFRVILGDDVLDNPLDDGLFEGGDPLFLGVSVDGASEFPGRAALVSAPYAIRAGTAGAVDGGVVDASEIRVGGQLVFDASGGFVGEVAETTLGDLTCSAGQVPRFASGQWGCSSPAGTVQWTSVTAVPAAIADGDADSLATLTCSNGQTIARSGSTWICVTPPGEATVEGWITDDPLDLDPGTTLGGLVISTGPHTVDTTLTESQVEAFVTDDAIDLAPGSTVGGVAISVGPHTVDTVLTEAQVEAYVTDGPIDLEVGSTMGGVVLSVGPHTVDTTLTEQQVETYVTNGPLALDAGTTIGGVALGAFSPVVVDFRYAQTSTAMSLSGTIPWDDTVPQNTEGGEITGLNVTITPKKVGNLLVFSGTVNWVEPSNHSNYFTVGLFRDGTAGALATATDAASNGNGRCTYSGGYQQICTLPFRFVATATSTSATTFRIRAGLDGGTVYINQGESGGRKLGGSLYSTLMVTEIAQ